MDKGPPIPPIREGQKSGFIHKPKSKHNVLEALRNEPSLYTGILKSLVVLLVGLGFFSNDVGGVVISSLTTVIVLLLSVIDREKSVGPVTHEKALIKSGLSPGSDERERRP